MVDESTGVQLLRTIALPVVDGIDFGPLHTFLEDKAGNLYLSDEVNNRVCSIDPAGKLRWQLGGRGSGPRQLHYPKGWISAGSDRRMSAASAWPYAIPGTGGSRSWRRMAVA